MRIFEEEGGIISEESIWVCICGPYMYTGDTLLELVKVLNSEWEHDKHLVG